MVVEIFAKPPPLRMAGSDVKSTLGRLLPNPKNYWNGGGGKHTVHTHTFISTYTELSQRLISETEVLRLNVLLLRYKREKLLKNRQEYEL